MKRFVFSLLLGLFIMPFAMAQESEPLPDAEVLKAANDSILAEAYLLCLFEKSAWVLEDVLAASIMGLLGFASCGKSLADVQLKKK